MKVGGVFVTKVFRSGEYNKLLWVFNHLFKKVTPTKPQSSRNVSAEIFVVCEGFTAPKKIDSKLLDPKFVLKTVDSGTFIKSIFAKKESRHRTGYEDGVGAILFKQGTVKDFIEAEDPVAFLGSYNQIIFDDDSKHYETYTITTNEIKSCLEDLKVLNKRDFTNLLKWRARIRNLESEDKESDSENDQEPMELTKEEEEAKMLEEMTKELSELDKAKKKKLKKRKEEKMKQKKRLVFSKDMADINEQTEDDEALFNLKLVGTDESNAQDMPEEFEEEEEEYQEEDEEDLDIDERERRYQIELEDYFDKMYNDYLYNTKRNRKKALSVINEEYKQDNEEIPVDEDFSDIEEDVDISPSEKLILRPLEEAKLKTSLWFEQDEFKDLIDDNVDEQVEISKRLALIKPAKKVKTEEIDEDEDFEKVVVAGTLEKKKKKRDRRKNNEDEKKKEKDILEIVPITEFPELSDGEDSDDESGEDSFEVVDKDVYSDSDSESSYDSNDKAEILAIAKKLRDKTKRKELLDAELHKFQYSDLDSLPKWFTDEEKRHTFFNAPITKDEVQIMKDKLKEINARDPKKVAEAKARKKMRLVKNLEKAKAKASKIMESEEIPDSAKVKEIERLYTKARSKTKMKKQYLVTKKVHKGKPNFVKPKGNSKIKNVDPRMKKDRRSIVAKEKKSKKRKRS